MGGLLASSNLRTACFALSGTALTCTLSLSGSLAGIAAGHGLALALYWAIGRSGLPARAAGAPRLIRRCAWGLAALCAAFFALGFGGELAVRFPALTFWTRWGISAVIGALSVYSLQAVLNAVLTAACPGTRAFIRSLSRNEIVFLLLWTATFSGVVVFLFTHSTAFDTPLWLPSGGELTPVPWNAVYSVDTPSLLEEFAAPGYAEVRHPLFTLLVFPLGLIANAAGRLWPLARPIALAVCCGAMLALSALLLWRMTRNPWIPGLYALSHPVWVYSLCAERYQLSVLLLVLSAYLIVHSQSRGLRWGALIAAAGATATSAFLSPMLHECGQARWRGWLLGLLRWAAYFVAVCILAGRGAVLLSAFTDAGRLLGEHAGAPLLLMDRLAQYSSFITACFIATPFGRMDSPWPRLSWLPVTGIDWIGVTLLALCILGFALRRREQLAQICGAWMAFSVLLMPVIGWGGGEFPFFSIYFSWAAIPLACFGLDGLTRRSPAARFCLFAIALTAVACVNLAALAELADFAFIFYPR